MAKKLKFKPIITRIKLNPEQAVLWCACYTGNRAYRVNRGATAAYCLQGPPKRYTDMKCSTVANSAAVS